MSSASCVTWLKGVDRDVLADDLVAQAAKRRPARMHGHLLDLVAADDIDDATVVEARAQRGVRRCGAPAPAAAAGPRATARSIFPTSLDAGRSGGCSTATRTAWPSSRTRLDEASRRVLVRRLVREGVLRIVREPLNRRRGSRAPWSRRTGTNPWRRTASRVRKWMLVEQPGPWGYDALVDSRLDADIAQTLGDACASPPGSASC